MTYRQLFEIFRTDVFPSVLEAGKWPQAQRLWKDFWSGTSYENLDQEVPADLVDEALARFDKVLYLRRDGVICSHQNQVATHPHSLITPTEVLNRFGVQALDEALEFGSSRVGTEK
jgi:hypothetical protein